MSEELARLAPPQCRLQTVRVGGAHGAFTLSQVEHATRRFAPHFFTTFAFGVVDSGRCRVTTPRGSWIAGPGSLLSFSPGELHCAQVISDERYAYRMAYFSADYLRALAARKRGESLESSRELVPVSDPSPLSAPFMQAHREVSHDPASDAASARLLRCSRALMESAVVPVQHRAASKELALVETAKEFLTAHIRRRVRLESVAETCGATAFRLIRVFRRITGLSPYAYLVVLRVNEARRMLDAGASVSDSAYACCFSDQSHLTRVFKRTLGMPPGLYLRSSR